MKRVFLMPLFMAKRIFLILLFVAIGALIATIALRGGNTQESATPTAEMNQSETASATTDTGASFADGVFETADVRIEINEARKIEVGAPGNEYGQKPVLAFWYDTTNKTGEKMTPLEWISIFTAIQDNDPNAVNQLGVGSLPDFAFLESQTEEIKPGGTVSNAIAYKLDDKITPVELVASIDFGSIEIGRQTFPLQ